MARRASLRGLSTRARLAKFDEAKHRRGAGGQFTDKPGAGDDAPRPTESPRVTAARAVGRVGDERRPQPGANPPEHDAALRGYAGSARATYINERLRFPDEVPPLDAQDMDVVRGMDAAIAAGRLDADEVLYRGLSADAAKNFDALQPGQMLVDRAFVSTSRSRNWAASMGAQATERGPGTLMEIRAPAGTPAAQPQHNPQEQEVVLGRGTRMRYAGRGDDGRYVFDVVPGRGTDAPPHLSAEKAVAPSNFTPPSEEEFLQSRPDNIRKFLEMSPEVRRKTYQEYVRQENYVHVARIARGSPFTEEETNTLRNYCGTTSNFRSIQASLRGGAVPDEARRMDEMMTKSHLPEDTSLWRGVAENFYGLDGLKEGDVVVDLGFTSTSMERSHARLFQKKGSMLEIRAPAGSPAVLPGRLPDRPVEYEVILPRSSRLRFAGKKGRVYVFDLVADV